MKTFVNRAEAGKQLAERVCRYQDRKDIIVLGLPRGGVVVAFEISRRIRAPLDVFLVRKLGCPGHEELAMGAIASGGIKVMNDNVLMALHVSPEAIQQVVAKEERELQRRENVYRRGRTLIPLHEKTVILVDDGLATGATMRAAIEALKASRPQAILVAVPTAPPDTVETIEKQVDEVVCLMTPEVFSSIGQWYDDFSQTTDEEVCELLDESREWDQQNEA